MKKGRNKKLPGINIYFKIKKIQEINKNKII